MTIDASAVARVLGITTQFKDLRSGSVLFLPQRIAVLAQGATDAVFSATKRAITSAAEAGSLYGWGSPIHHIVRQLMPSNGDGIGTVPVTVYPLVDAGGGAAAAAGDITPSGSQTKAAAYRVKINNVLSEAFVIPVGASVTTICRLIGEAIAAILEMPMKVGYTYGTVTASPDGGNSGNGTVTVLSVTGTPAPGSYLLTCTGAVADGGVFSLTDPDGTVIATGLTMTPGVGGATVINTNGIQFTLTDGTNDFAVDDFFTITVPATKVVLTAKWKGTSGNDLYVEVEGEDLGTTFTITQPTGGLVNPSVAAALAQMGNVWETMVINALEIADTTVLDAIQTVGDGRWGELVRKPFVAFTGCTDGTVAAATAVSSARTTDKVNAQLVAPGSKDLPFVVAARQLARIAKVANNNPARDYGSQQATGLVPGADGDQWDYTQRDAAVKAGSSTIEVRDGVVHIGDVVTFYRPAGDPNPGYRYVCDIVKLQNILFNIDLVFATAEWDGAPMIPDEQPTTNPEAKKPKMAKAAAAGVLDALGLAAIISDPEKSKKDATATLDPGNPKRLNLVTPVRLSGNTNIIDYVLNFGFHFGSSAAA